MYGQKAKESKGPRLSDPWFGTIDTTHIIWLLYNHEFLRFYPNFVVGRKRKPVIINTVL